VPIGKVCDDRIDVEIVAGVLPRAALAPRSEPLEPSAQIVDEIAMLFEDACTPSRTATRRGALA